MTWDSSPGETPIDASGLKIPDITTRAELNVHEAENIRKATVTYLAGRPSTRQASFSVDWMLRLHEQMFGDVWEWAGTPRKTQNNLGVAAYQITEELEKLEDDIAFWTTNVWLRREGHPLVRWPEQTVMSVSSATVTWWQFERLTMEI